MRGVIGRLWVTVWLGCITAAAAQLPPEIQVDRYLLRADRLMEAKDPKGALEVMGKIVVLQKEHGLTLPEEFHFKYARVALSAGSVGEAMDAVNTYLLEAGREGKFYREALELLEDVEQLSSWFDPEQTCAGKSEGAACWMEVTGQPGCYVWDGHLDTGESVTWSGECSGGRAQGEGTLKWVWDDGEKTSESTGSLKDGKEHGQWVKSWWHGGGAEGPYVEGKRHGHWVESLADGDVWEGPYVEGKRHGQWVVRYDLGGVSRGPYVDGEKHGRWFLRFRSGGVSETQWVKGNLHGHSVERRADGTVEQEGSYVEHKKHGHWVSLRRDGTVFKEGPYVEGEKHGHWVEPGNEYESVDEGSYVDGKRDGKWVERFDNGRVWEGPYVDGKRHGQWIERLKNGSSDKGPYVEGKRHGHWVHRGEDGNVYEEGPYFEGKRHGHWVLNWSGVIGGVQEGPYVDGKRHGRWVVRNPLRRGSKKVKVTVEIYENGKYVRAEDSWEERRRKK